MIGQENLAGLYALCIVSGAHNDNEKEKGEGRSANRPRERLKCRIFLTVVALLSLEHWRNAHGANPLTGHKLRSLDGVSNFLRWEMEEKLVAAGDAGFVSVE